jgi:hypothetical protein
MRSWRFWERDQEEESKKEPEQTRPAGTVAPRAKGFRAPAPRDAEALRASTSENSDQLERLLRRRDSIVFDVEQSESALDDDNIWTRRVETLDEAIANVLADRTIREVVNPLPAIPLPPTPIEDISVETGPPASASFRIGNEVFTYEEEIDWAERGTQIVRPDLNHVAGDPSRILPADFAGERHEALIAHLRESLFELATALRDEVIETGTTTIAANLAALAKPCPVCGNWLDWHGICQTCRLREWDLQQLAAEEQRLRTERAHELEERNRLVERLPIARRRLAEVDAEIAALSSRA